MHKRLTVHRGHQCGVKEVREFLTVLEVVTKCLCLLIYTNPRARTKLNFLVAAVRKQNLKTGVIFVRWYRLYPIVTEWDRWSIPI